MGEDGPGEPVERGASGDGHPGEFATVLEVRETLAAGYLFELTHRVEGKERRVIATLDEIVRPAALPPDSPRVCRFRGIAEIDTFEVPLPALVALEPISIEAVPPSLQHNVLVGLRDAGTDNPTRIPMAETEALLRRARADEADPAIGLTFALLQLRGQDTALEDLTNALVPVLERADDAVGRAVLAELERRAGAEPAALEPHVPGLASLVHGSAYAAEAASCLARLAEADPAVALDAVPTLAAAAESADARTRRWLHYTFSVIAERYPEELFPALDVLVDAIRTGDDDVRKNALSAVGRITSSYPDAAASVIDDVAALLAAEDAQVRGNVAGVLGDVAQTHPGEVIAHAPALARLLADPAGDVRHNASITLLRAGAADPPAVRAEHERLGAALDDERAEVRRNVCALVGNSYAPVPAERLRALRDADPDEGVRERAGWALERLESRE